MSKFYGKRCLSMDIYVTACRTSECELYCNGKLYVISKGNGLRYCNGEYVDKIIEIIKKNTEGKKYTVYADSPKFSSFNKDLIQHFEKRSFKFEIMVLGCNDTEE